MLNYLTGLLRTLKGWRGREGGDGGSEQNRRRAARISVRLPLRVFILGTESSLEGVRYRPTFDGYTRDVSSIGLSSVLTAAQLEKLNLGRDYRRLRITLGLPGQPIQIYATTVRQKVVDRQAGTGWLIGARITKMSPDDRATLLSYLNELN